ncbi:MAG: hypothetical protein ACLP6G_09935 [Terriglobales bacterium]
MTMSPLSTARKLGIAARVAGQQVRRTRTFGAVVKAGQVAAARWGRILGQLWLEVTGFVFLALAAIGGMAFWREWTKHRSPGRLALAAAFTILFGWFGASSFWRVSKKH